MTDEKFKNYMFDLGMLLKDKARAAKKANDCACDEDSISYASGYLMAFHEVIDLMKVQANVFNIKQQDIGLLDIDPESELL